jgi:hypothetical protein
VAKSPSGKNESQHTPKVARDAGTGKFVESANKWASANSTSREAARAKLQQLGIHDNSGKLAKDYK